MMPINRRELFKGAGAFLGAATVYVASDTGVFLPYDKIITDPIPPWSGKTMITAFEGEVLSYNVNAELDSNVKGSLDGRMIGSPIIKGFDFGMEFYGDNMPNTSILTSRIYVQIFQRMD